MSSSRPSIAVVLGAGGVLGTAYHVGVLAALHEVLDFDARDADLIVGTSAGANTAATLRAGFSALDHFARATDRELSDKGDELLSRATTDVDLSPAKVPTLGVPSSGRLIAGGIRPLRRSRPVVSISGVLPRGTFSLLPLAARANEFHDTDWPARPTWICAVSMTTSQRAVFGRDDLPDADIGTAVAASSAVPGMFAPVDVGGHDFIDGGVHSTTNVDLVVPLAFDAVIISAPMTANVAKPGYRIHGLSRTWHTRTLQRELADLPRRTRRAVLSPSEGLLEEMGSDNMAADRVASVAEHSRAEAISVLSGDRHERLRRVLGQASTADTSEHDE